MALLAVGLVFAGWLTADTVRTAAPPVAFALDASSPDVTEHWSGIYVGDQKIGYSVRRSAPHEGGLRLQERTQLRLMLLGQTNDVTMATDLEVAADGAMQTLLAQVRTEVQGLPVTLRAEGERKGDGMALRVSQGGRTVTEMELPRVPATPATLYRSVVADEPTPGTVRNLPYFNPLSVSSAEATIEVVEKQRATLPEGEEVDAWLLRVDNSGQQIEALVTGDGRRLWEREIEGGLGMRIQAETAQQATEEGWAVDAEGAVDLIALSSIPLDRKLPGGGRGLTELTLRVRGPESLSPMLAAAHGEHWDPQTSTLRLVADDVSSASDYALPSRERALQPWLRSTTFVPADHPRISKQAGQIVGERLQAVGAARALNSWVYESLQKVPVAGVPDALEILTSRRGDCNEHTTLYTALARSLGLPTRMAAGIVYSEAIFADGAFYYHAWPEVWLGDS